MVRLSQFARLAALLALGAALSGVWYPTRSLDTPTTAGEVTGKRSYARTAAYDGGFIAVWEDARRAPRISKSFGARLTVSGAVLDPSGIPIGVGPWLQWDPAVSCIEFACLVAYSDGEFGIAVRTLDAVTGLLGPPVTVNAMPAFLTQPALANNGAQFLVAWGTPTELAGVVLSPQAVPQSPLITMPSATGSPPGFPAIAVTGNKALVTWTEFASPGFRVYAQGATVGGAPLTRHTFGLTPAQTQSAVATDGSSFLVAWGSSTGDVVGRRVADDGTLIDLADVDLASTGNDEAWPAVAFDGTNYLLAWVQNQRSLNFAFLSPATLATAAGPTTVTTDALEMARLSLALHNADGFVTWARKRRELAEWFGSGLFRLPGGTTVLWPDAGYLGQKATQRADAPRAVRLGDGWALVWSAHRDLLGTPAWVSLGPQGELLSVPAPLGSGWRDFSGLDVASDGTRLYAIWSTGDDVLASSFLVGPTSASTVSPGPPFWSSSPPVIASRAGHAGMLWSAQTGASSNALMFREWDPLGLVGPDAGTLAVAPDFIERVSLTAGPGAYLAGWQSAGELRVSRLDSPGVLSNSAGRVLGQLAVTHAASASATDYLVVWAPNDGDRVLGQRLDANGALASAQFEVKPPGWLRTSVPNPTDPSVAFDGEAFLVAWAAVAIDGGASRVEARRVFLDGGLGPIEVLASSAFEPGKVNVAAGTPGRVLVT
jgi:hypothetical protein